jgi:hypothetical protein
VNANMNAKTQRAVFIATILAAWRIQQVNAKNLPRRHGGTEKGRTKVAKIRSCGLLVRP